MAKPSKTTVDIWIRLARAHQAVLSSIEKALKTAGFPPLSWYDVLLELVRAEPEGLRAFELQKKLLLPQYGLSRLLAKIEDAGYLERVACDEDGRGQIVTITPSGRAMRQSMWAVYSVAIEQGVGAKLNKPDREILAKLLMNLT